MHSEVSEALEEYRVGGPLEEIYYRCSECGLFWHPDRNPGEDSEARSGKCMCGGPLKPEGFVVELADLLIRVADYCGRFKITPLVTKERSTGHVRVGRLVRLLHRELESDHMERRWLGHVIGMAISYSSANNLPLERAIAEKMAYNRTRPYRHGGKVA
jgi:hypothetical protein